MAEREAGQVLATRPEPGERIDLMRARDVADIKVQNPEGENIGDITDIAIDRDGGCIAYAVLAYGGILGFGEKHFAIPWEAVRVRSREKIAIVDTDKKTLDNASGFTRDKMPREGDWSVIRTPPRPTAAKERPAAEGERPPPKEEKPAAPAEPAPRTVESYTPVPPPVQTVAGGWGEKAMKPRTEEQPARAAGAVVEEVRREEPARAEAKATEVRH
ncbi:PRC-barrel domain-containing protein, partial [Methanoculleus sp.]